MDAFISGRNGVAIIIDGDRLLSMSIDPESPPAACSQRDVRLLLGNARDVVLVGDASEEQIRARLVTAREQDDGLELALFTLDAELSEETRTDAAAALEELLAGDEVRAFVQNVLLSLPAPKTADLRGALRIAQRARAGVVETLLLCLGSLQPKVEEVWSAWEALPATLFEGEHHRTDARAAFVRAGLFSALVRGDQRAFSESAASPEVAAIEGYEAMLLAWSTASSRESRTRMTFRYAQIRQDPEPTRTLEARDEPPGKRIRRR
jgi:hypothetical protein